MPDEPRIRGEVSFVGTSPFDRGLTAGCGARADAGAAVPLHSSRAAAFSILADIDPADVLPAPTAYRAMRVGRLPLVPAFAPGGPDLAHAVRACLEIQLRRAAKGFFVVRQEPNGRDAGGVSEGPQDGETRVSPGR